jgi:hypothetical protein
LALDLNYHSYFSIMTGADSNALSDTADEEENIFDEDSYGTFTTTIVSSPDITFTSSDGKITFGAAGTYLFVGDIGWIVSADGTDTTIKIYKNGVLAYQMTAIPAFVPPLSPTTASYHTVLDIDAGDYIEVKVSSDDTGTITIQEGATFVALKANGDYGNITYTAAANAGSAGALEVIGDSDLGGTVSTNLKNVTYTATAGTLTPTNTRPFLMLSTLAAMHTKQTEVAVSLYANGSALDASSATIHKNLDPQEVTYGILKALTGGQTASSRFESTAGSPGQVTIKGGTSFTIFDTSYNGATYPSAYISLGVDADSNNNTTGDIICFDSNEWGSYADTDHVTATGITFTADGGTFVVGHEGKYFILWNLIIGSVSASDTTRTVKIKNGTTVVYTAPWRFNQNFDPLEKTVCLIVNAAAGDSFTFVVNNPDGDFDAGTAISMFKIDDVNDLYIQTVPSDPPIENDYVINNYTIDSLSAQHDRAAQNQVPFILGSKTTLNLRGRRPLGDTSANSVAVEYGGKKTK